MTPAPIDFFKQPKEASLYKLDLLGKYLRPWSYKLGSGWKQLWIVDGFAGAGAYDPDSNGAVQDGSPVIAAKWAREQEHTRGYPVIRCLNAEQDDAVFRELERQLEPWADLVENFRGSFADRLDEILAVIGRDPAFFFLDPFGVNGIEMDVVETILERRGRQTEMLLHFSESAFKRMAGHAAPGDRSAVGEKVAAAKLARLDQVLGTPLWRPHWLNATDPDAAMDVIVELYLSQLKARGFSHANQIAMRPEFGARSRYRLVFATQSAHGTDLMSDLACRYERELEERHRPGQDSLFAADEAVAARSSLADHIHAVGVRSGRMTPAEVRHALVDAHFGKYTATDYAKAIRGLVSEGRIRRKNATGIKDDEPLRFEVPPQGSLLDELEPPGPVARVAGQARLRQMPSNDS